MTQDATRASQVMPNKEGEAKDGEKDLFGEVRRARIWDKLKAGEMYKITFDEVYELYSLMDPEGQGDVPTDALSVFQSITELGLTADDIKALANECDADQSGKISCQELFKALTVGSVAMRQILQGFSGHKKLGQGEVDRQDLIDFMEDHYNKETALWSLPQTVLLFVSFTVSVICHIDVGTAFKMQESLAGGVEGEGGPFLQKYVHDIPSMWDWMDTSFIGVFLENDLVNFPYPGRLESYNQIIGGVQLKKTDVPPANCAQSEKILQYYDTQRSTKCDDYRGVDEEALTVESKFVFYHENNEANLKMFKHLRNGGYLDDESKEGEFLQGPWVNLNTSQLTHKVLFYNAYLGAFTNYDLTFDFNYPLDYGKKDGVLHMYFTQETWLAEPYDNRWTVLPDFIFIFIILKMIFGELQEVVPALMNGLDGFIDYWDFWNGVDWASMILGLVYIIMWADVSLNISWDLQDAIAAAGREDTSTTVGGGFTEIPAKHLDKKVRDSWAVNGTYLSREGLDHSLAEIGRSRADLEDYITMVHEISDTIAGKHETLRLMILINSFVLLLKFFKAFKANPRLDIVIQTLQASFIDLVHFMFVFITIWMVFALTGYIRFGTYCQEFSSYWRAIMISWRILMGEDIVEDMEEGSGSLHNFLIANIWVIFFQAVMAIILMNMTVAIIMDAYTQVNSSSDKTEIWTQVRTSLRTARETKGFLGLWYLICEFNDDDEPAHPGKVVTVKSLRRAFERDKMTKANAEWLVSHCKDFVEQKESQVELSLNDAVKVIGQVRTYVMKINDATQETLQMLRAERRAPMDARYDAILRGEDPQDMHQMPAQGMMNGKTGAVPGQLALTNGAHQQSGGLGTTASSGFGFSNGFNNGTTAQTVSNTTMAPAIPGQMEMQLATTSAAGQSAIPGSQAAMAQQQQQRQMMQAVAQNSMILEQLESVTRQINRIGTKVTDDMKVTGDRFTQLEQRIWGLERRSERVEKACDQLRNTFQGADFGELLRLPDSLPRQVAAQVANTMQGLDSSGMGDAKSVRGKVDHLTKVDEKLGALLARAEEQQEMKNMMWRIDLGVRSLKNAGGGSSSEDLRPGSHPPPGRSRGTNS
jgi:Ca2+-binding EF-hand superfamily protein